MKSETRTMEPKRGVAAVSAETPPPVGKESSMTASVKRSLSLADAAEQLCCSGKTVKRLIDRGEIVAYKLGWQWRIDCVDLDGYIGQRKREQSLRTGRISA